MHELVDFLRSRGMRCFRSYRDDEYFFVVDWVCPGRLYVNLGVGADGAITVTVTPDRFYPAEARGRLAMLLAGWDPEGTRELCLDAAVHDSSDPGRVGATLFSRGRPADLIGAAEFVDRTVACAVDLFGRLDSLSPARPVTPPRAAPIEPLCS